jgi:hypothetical protein
MRDAIRTGDYVRWRSKIFKKGSIIQGRFVGAKLIGEEIFEGKVIKHSYGIKTDQHTFTILLDSGKKKLVKGRNLYPNLLEHEVDKTSPDRVCG